MSTVLSTHQICCTQIKPDGVQRGLVGAIIARFEAKGEILSCDYQGFRMLVRCTKFTWAQPAATVIALSLACDIDCKG